MAIVRDQTTGKTRVTGAGTSCVTTFGTLPVSGSTVVVGFVILSGNLVLPGDCTDNQGNTYYPALFNSNSGGPSIYMWFARSVISAGTFTVTVNPSNEVGFYGFGVATSFTGLGAKPSLDLTIMGKASATTTPTVPTSPALTNSNALVWAAVTSTSNAFTVESVSPAWTQEAEETNFGDCMPGEFDSKIVTAGGAQTCNWTTQSQSYFSGLIALIPAPASGSASVFVA